MQALIPILLVIWSSFGMAIESPRFKLEKQDGDFEIRRYEPTLIAETTVSAAFSDAGSLGFRRLADFIFGNNVSSEKIAMTAPVGQQVGSEKIAMTAPVSQVQEGDQYVISFTMPSSYTIETLPKPKDPSIRIRQLPERRLAVIRYSGTWGKERYLDHLALLQEWMQKEALQAVGEPSFARYNPPWMPWFLRRNEIFQEIKLP